jgi:hypothetical protein
MLGLRLILRSRLRRILGLFDSIADIVRNWFRKPGLQRRRLLLPLFFGRLFAPLRTVAHPSAHIALVTRFGVWRQCRALHLPVEINHTYVTGDIPNL